MFGLLTTSAALPLTVRTIIASLVRELVTEVPRFFPLKFSAYGEESLPQILGLFRELSSGDPLAVNVEFLTELLHSPEVSIALKLEALTTILHTPGAVSSGCIDHFIADVLLTSSAAVPAAKKTSKLLRMVVGNRVDQSSSVSMLELDGTPVTDDLFTVLLHSRTGNFSDQQLLHVGVFSILFEFLKQRLCCCEAPPNTPVGNSGFPAAISSHVHVVDAVVSLGIRILAQCQKEISSVIFCGKKSFKFVPPNLVRWTRELTESVLVETLKCLDLVCRQDPSVVSLVFPHVRKVYERVLLREDSPGTGVTQTLKFFLSHSYMVIFDIEPALRFFFTIHLGRKSPILAAESVIFLNQFAHQLCTNFTDLVKQHIHVLLRLAAWYPRTIGPQVVEFISHLPPSVELFHGIIDLPLVAATSELTLAIGAYVDAGGTSSSAADQSTMEGDQFALARAAMRIFRSFEFKDIIDCLSNGVWCKSERSVSLLTELWKGIVVSPRVAAASKLVPQLLSVVELGGSPAILNAVLARFGPGKIFLFRSSDIGSVLIEFIRKAMENDSVLVRHREEVVSAIVERIGNSECEKFIIFLVQRIGKLDSDIAMEALPLLVRTLRWLLGVTAPPSERLDIVCVRSGRVVPKASDKHPCLDSGGCVGSASAELSCVVVTALTRIAVRYPQYRDQTRAMLRNLLKENEKRAETVVSERIHESVVVLNHLSISRRLVGLSC